MDDYFQSRYPLPNFIIAGAAKSASSSVHRYLSEHPHCLMSHPDNPAFFCQPGNLPSPDVYKNFFPPKEKVDFEKTDIVGEGTAVYMFLKEVAERIDEFYDKPIKLLFVLRNPVDRSISHYWQGAKKFTDERSLQEVFDFDSLEKSSVLQIEQNKIQKAKENGKLHPSRANREYINPLQLFRYIHCSFYSDHLERFEQHFDHGQIKIVLMERLKEDPKKLLKEIENFLGIKEFIPENLQKRYNKTIVPKRDVISSLVHDYLKPLAGTLFSGMERKPQFLRKIYHSLTFQEKPEPSEKLKKDLETIFQPEQKLLAEKYNLPTHELWDL